MSIKGDLENVLWQANVAITERYGQVRQYLVYYDLSDEEREYYIAEREALLEKEKVWKQVNEEYHSAENPTRKQMREWKKAIVDLFKDEK